MPPRRSSRSTQASAEPTNSESLPTKRKRAQVVESDTEDKEPVAKPASRTRKSTSARSSVAPASKGRNSTRSRGSLPEVPETNGDDEEDPPPPVKKPRPSAEMAKQEEDSDVEEKPKGKRAASSSKRVKSISAASKAASTSTRSGRASRAVVIEESADEGIKEEVVDGDEEDDVEPAPKTSRKGAKTNGRSSSRRASKNDDDDMYLSDEAPKATSSKGRKPKAAPQTRKSRVPAKTKATHVIEDSDDEAPPSNQEVVSGRQTGLKHEVTLTNGDGDEIMGEVTNTKEGHISEEEDEHSLFDPPPMPTPSTLPTAIPEEPAGPKSRLVIHKMALINFKSYAGRQEIGPFHKSFSSIVGPNGSGKSNTIDALLFVFGYRASKMRQGKLSELIHNSAKYPDLGECSVEVHFREIVDLPGPDAFEVVPDSQLIVTRQAFKNNSSKYTINGRQSNYTEVQTLLKGRGIDLDHNRFLILQGEVESIAQMKPKAPSDHEDGLLEYLEDIIGTSKFKQPIDDAMVEMERLQEERGVKLNRLRLVEKEKTALEKQKREAEDYLRLKNDHARALSRLWQWVLWQCFENESIYKNKITKLEKQLEAERKENADDVKHLEMLRTHYQGREKAYDEIHSAAVAAVKDLTTNEKEEVELQERRKHSASKAKKLKKSIQEDTSAKNKAARDIEDNSEKMKKEKTKVDEYEASLVQEEKVLEGIRDSLKDKTQVFHDQIEVKQKELQPWTAKINTKRAEIDVASSEREALVKRAEALKTAGKEAQETLEGLQGDQAVKVKEYEKLKDTKNSLQRDIDSAEKKLKDSQASVQDLRSKASSSRQKVDEARASQASNKSQNNVLDSLTRLKNAGRIQGFHGRLGSLGTIPDKYDVAVSTACPTLNHIVVDKVEQGQACIEYLRSQNVGRASFMVLEKLPNNPGMASIDTPEGVPRLYDLIKPKDPRFAPAFYKATGNTLVAENMEQANRIAFGARRWRVVTLIGQLIDTSGAMSGGGNQLQKGAMSSKLAADAVRPEVLRKYEEESQDAAQRLEAALQGAREAEAELDRLRTSGPQIDMAFQKLGLDIENGKRRIPETEKRVRDLKSQSKPDAGDLSRISVLDEEIASSTEELEGLEAKSGKIEKAIKDLEQKILDIGGAKLLTQKSKVDGIKLHISLANDEITKAEVAKAKAIKDEVKLKTTLETNTAALEEVDNVLKKLEADLEDLTAYVTELRDKVEAAQAAAESSKEDLQNLKKDLDAKDQEIEKFRQKEMEIQQDLSDQEKEKEKNEGLILHWQTEHDKLRLEDVDDEDDEDEDEETSPPGEKSDQQDDEVKAEPGGPRKKKPRESTPANDFHTYSTDELSRFKKQELVADTELLDEKIKNSKPDLSVLKEYRKREEEFLNRAKDLENITDQRDKQKQAYDGLRKQRLDEFMAGFNLISLKLKEMYQMITLGGNAELELVDSMDPFSEGIIFSVMPPKKSWKNISNLSGGEKTLSSLALVFALHVFKPTPLYFMDEIDAALDFRNVSIVANYIKDRTKNAQFIIISLRNDMFELSHRLIGIYKTSNATRSISIDNHALTNVPPPPSAI
ncbi:RecF/RecN/SMC N terminal domain-containing protein [Collybia nuda]|uniref:Structural maintenance of chromosomes protein 4 n=1 Tax=Collybia nuda TaxID=64659 RepID=A0A9P5YIC0_9AGAR|nr:RecF/RecN/SMC N terminal domain-containing protein [Collybia nuda]